MNAFEKLQLSLEKLWWGSYHPALYVTKNSEGRPCGMGFAYANRQQDAVFNLWIWLSKFKTPEQMCKVSLDTQIRNLAYASKYAEMFHKDVEIGVEALRLTPEQFQDYIEDFSGLAVSRNGGWKAKKSALE